MACGCRRRFFGHFGSPFRPRGMFSPRSKAMAAPRPIGPRIMAIPSIDQINADLQQLQQMQLDHLYHTVSSRAQLGQKFDHLGAWRQIFRRSTSTSVDFSRRVARYAVATQKAVEGMRSIILEHQNNAGEKEMANAYLQMGRMAAFGPPREHSHRQWVES